MQCIEGSDWLLDVSQEVDIEVEYAARHHLLADQRLDADWRNSEKYLIWSCLCGRENEWACLWIDFAEMLDESVVALLPVKDLFVTQQRLMWEDHDVGLSKSCEVRYGRFKIKSTLEYNEEQKYFHDSTRVEKKAKSRFLFSPWPRKQDHIVKSKDTFKN